ncbi:hypothetical protein WJX75_002136 [Coccomyxa subellipsoidea]|uniref:Secreted protein n=1 Tax=Coccomyxa subellipsoidea TaxID=248742 RepID=A0ABR2YAG2_9CHLO
MAVSLSGAASCSVAAAGKEGDAKARSASAGSMAKQCRCTQLSPFALQHLEKASRFPQGACGVPLGLGGDHSRSGSCWLSTLPGRTPQR